MSTRISFITFTRNSGKRLKLLLENVKDVVDEIIVVDGFSVDDTVEIARSYGAKVFQRKPWGHVEPDRMFALSKASYDWILYLDDDELLGRKLKNDLRDLIEKADKEGFVALSTVRVYYDVACGQLILGSSLGRQIRIYRKDRVMYRGLIHELPAVYGKILDLPEEYLIVHYGSQGSLSARKIVFYALLESLEYYQHPFVHSIIKRTLWGFSPLSAPLIILRRLIIDCIIKRNHGLNLCTLTRAVYPYFFYEIAESILTRFRDKRRTQISKIIQKYGLIKLLEREAS